MAIPLGVRRHPLPENQDEWRRRRFQDRFLQQLDVEIAGDVLDVGCMDGRFTARFAERARSVVGLDIVPHTIWERLRGPNLRFVVGDAQRLPFADASFDVVLAVAMLHHTASPISVIREMARVRRPGGTLVMVEPNRLNPVTWLHLTLFSDHDHFRTKPFIRLVDRVLPIQRFHRFEAHLWPPGDGPLLRALERMDDALGGTRWWRPFALWNVVLA